MISLLAVLLIGQCQGGVCALPGQAVYTYYPEAAYQSAVPTVYQGAVYQGAVYQGATPRRGLFRGIGAALFGKNAQAQALAYYPQVYSPQVDNIYQPPVYQTVYQQPVYQQARLPMKTYDLPIYPSPQSPSKTTPTAGELSGKIVLTAFNLDVATTNATPSSAFLDFKIY